jgi:hypothetical protein
MLTPPPLYPSVETPANEIAAVKDLSANLWGVAYNVEAWAAALHLYEFATQRPTGVSAEDSRRWRFIAANECVHQLHHLRVRLEKIKGHKVRACPSLASNIEVKKLRRATRLLDEYFPDIDQLRHAVAHAGANDVLPADHAPEHGYLLVGFREKDRYTAPYQGADRNLEITAETLSRIEEVASEFLDAFESAAKLLERQGHLE